MFARLTVDLGADRSVLKLGGKGNKRIRIKRVKRVFRETALCELARLAQGVST